MDRDAIQIKPYISNIFHSTYTLDLSLLEVFLARTQ